MQISYHAQDCLRHCVDLQLRYKRWGKELAIGELMRMAVLQEPSKAMVIAVCRLLFVPKTGEILQRPALGEPCYVGDTSVEDWPLEPIHVYNSVPFFIARNWGVAGLPDRAEWYLAHCLLHGVWNEKPYKIIDQEQLERTAREFIEKGPWKRRPLAKGEEMFLLSQVQTVSDKVYG